MQVFPATLLLLLTTLLVSKTIFAGMTTIEQQRQLFQLAREAIKTDQQHEYIRLAQQLKNYPLYPYLEFWHINRHLSTVATNKVRTFFDRYAELPLSTRLRKRWLNELATQKRWQELREFYHSDMGTEAECYHRRALYNSGEKQRAFDGLKAIWLRGHSQPKACDPLFDSWNKAGKLTPNLVWQRVKLAMKNNQTYLARYLERFLNQEQQTQVQLWRRVHTQPEKHLFDHRLEDDTEVNRSILAHGIRRLARRNASVAASAWDKLVKKYAFDEEAFSLTENYLAVSLARQNAPQAMHWLASLADERDPAVRTWRVMTAINQELWGDALFWLDQLQPREQRQNRWLYWRARALDKEKKNQQAVMIFSALAQKRSYYGFLAADHLEQTYRFESRPLRYSQAETKTLLQLPGMQRAKEFYLIGDALNARREWYALTQQLPPEKLPKAAQIAHQWGWHDQAIFTLGKARYLDDLEIRFPLVHRKQVLGFSSQQNIDPAWSYAVIRQESAFASDARSPKGAMGLMQIMPNTGRSIAKDLQTTLTDQRQLLEIDTNIRFGVSYLRKAMNRFNQNTVLATAAYNAGSQRVTSWLPRQGSLSPDIWIENIPYKETRNYLKRVLAYTAIYDKRLTRPIKPLKQRMPLIQAKKTPAS